METLSSLGIDLKILLAQLVNFGILIFLLSKFLYKPVLKMLDQRKKKIAESIKKAEEIEKKEIAIEGLFQRIDRAVISPALYKGTDAR